MIEKCDRCDEVAECCKAKINTGHFGLMTTFAKCVGAVSSTDKVEEGLLAQRTYFFCKKCIAILMPKVAL